MIFSARFQNESKYNIKLLGTPLKPQPVARYLGVFIQSNLLWTKHKQHLIAKAKKGLAAIKKIKALGLASPLTLVHLTTALVRSRLTYGCEVFQTQSDTDWNHLEVVELAALKVALNVNKGAINDLVYQECGLLPLRRYCQAYTASTEAHLKEGDNAVKTVLGPSSASDDNPHRQSIKRKHPRIFAKTRTLDSYTKPIWDDV